MDLARAIDFIHVWLMRAAILLAMVFTLTVACAMYRHLSRRSFNSPAPPIFTHAQQVTIILCFALPVTILGWSWRSWHRFRLLLPLINQFLSALGLPEI